MTRYSPEHPEIIYRPDLQPSGRRALFSAITLVAWILWFYLFMPLLSLGAWWFGVESFRHYMLDPERSGYLLTLTAYAIVVAVTALVIIGWSRYNQVRFSGPDRRHHMPPVTNEMIQEKFQLDAEMLQRVQKAKAIELDFEKGGKLTSAAFRYESQIEPEVFREASGAVRRS
ncbi:poly-beta-1,6-N-acetyl-D-glucosamine biosynthesis protein PgaD [Wenzhouxiangella sp. EGI_FJ10305]|uniref:poly-beta-1,6-N-acetyl-D-glucosamine biosynthesis protein PgaD n=1 Tax=Wenzhouxiangella sp. EGI_FJ10305 TaxID=3243768 RepID=UPI0035D62A58